jgi:hypothetical protein
MVDIFEQLLDEQHSVTEGDVVARFIATLSPDETADLVALEAARN